MIYPDPGFPAYETTIQWSGARAVPLRLEESSGFRFRHDTGMAGSSGEVMGGLVVFDGFLAKGFGGLVARWYLAGGSW